MSMDGWEPLYAAAQEGHVEIVKLLLDHGADITVISKDGWEPLYAASHQGHLEVVRLLLDHGAIITIVDKDGRTPLDAASSNGYVQVVQLLLNRGVNVMITDKDGKTALYTALEQGHVEVVELLLNHAADVTATDSCKKIPLYVAAEQGHVEVVRLLLDRQADTTVASNEGWMPLHRAALYGHIEVIELLIDSGVDIRVPDKSGLTSLCMASFNGHIKVVKLLLDNSGGDIVMNKDGMSLYAASLNGHIEVVKLLLDKDFDVTASNEDGCSALYATSDQGHIEIVRLLLDKRGMAMDILAPTVLQTYEPVLLNRKVELLRIETGNSALYVRGGRQLPESAVLKRAIVRPLKMLVLCPLITGLSLYIAAVYGFAYLLLSTFSIVFEAQYRFSGGSLGLVYLGLAGGMLLSMSLAGLVNDRTFVRLSKKHGEEKPEYHLESLIYGAIAIPIGLVVYGWTAENALPSVIPIMATGFVGFGVMFTFIPVQVYMTIAYTKYAASAIAASSVLRSIAGALVPLAGVPLYDRMGLGWGNSLLSLISVGLGALPLLFCRYGEGWRKRFAIELD